MCQQSDGLMLQVKNLTSQMSPLALMVSIFTAKGKVHVSNRVILKYYIKSWWICTLKGTTCVCEKMWEVESQIMDGWMDQIVCSCYWSVKKVLAYIMKI